MHASWLQQLQPAVCSFKATCWTSALLAVICPGSNALHCQHPFALHWLNAAHGIAKVPAYSSLPILNTCLHHPAGATAAVFCRPAFYWA